MNLVVKIPGLSMAISTRRTESLLYAGFGIENGWVEGRFSFAMCLYVLNESRRIKISQTRVAIKTLAPSFVWSKNSEGYHDESLEI